MNSFRYQLLLSGWHLITEGDFLPLETLCNLAHTGVMENSVKTCSYSLFTFKLPRAKPKVTWNYQRGNTRYFKGESSEEDSTVNSWDRTAGTAHDYCIVHGYTHAQTARG